MVRGSHPKLVVMCPSFSGIEGLRADGPSGLFLRCGEGRSPRPDFGAEPNPLIFLNLEDQGPRAQVSFNHIVVRGRALMHVPVSPGSACKKLWISLQ